MYQITTCPEHKEPLVFFQKTSTHSLFKCPVCDYVDYPGVVLSDLPERYKQLQAEVEELKRATKGIGCVCVDGKMVKIKD